MEFVRGQVGRLQGSTDPVVCPSCRAGRLRLDPEHWDDPNTLP